jgi:hypothetical protein
MSKRQWRRINRQSRKRAVTLPSGEVIKKSVPVAVRVRCEGKIHEVRWFAGGPMVLSGHTKQDIDARDTLGDMGAKDCKCLALLTQVRGGHGVRYAPKEGVGIDPKPFALCNTVSKHAKSEHRDSSQRDVMKMYGEDRWCRIYLPKPKEERERKKWIDAATEHYRAEMTPLVGYTNAQKMPLGWLLWHKKGLGDIDGNRVKKVLYHSQLHATVLMDQKVRLPGDAVIRTEMEVRLMNGMPLKKWAVVGYVGPKGNVYATAEQALGMWLLEPNEGVWVQGMARE